MCVNVMSLTTDLPGKSDEEEAMLSEALMLKQNSRLSHKSIAYYRRTSRTEIRISSRIIDLSAKF
jgi:hypothetical protein